MSPCTTSRISSLRASVSPAFSAISSSAILLSVIAGLLCPGFKVVTTRVLGRPAVTRPPPFTRSWGYVPVLSGRPGKPSPLEGLAQGLPMTIPIGKICLAAQVAR